MKKPTLTKLFIELAAPDKDGVSRWVDISEFKGKYESLKLGNGLSWGRASSALAKKYIIEVDRSRSAGESIDAVRLNGYNQATIFNQSIRSDIKNYYKTQNCVMLGINGSSENTRIEIDHKDGRKNDIRVGDIKSQRLEDFQPLCKAANDAKRQICKRCKQTNIRWDAKNIKGNPYSFYEGDEQYTEELGCRGCYQYDPVEYRKHCVRMISQEAADYIMNRIYPNN